MLNVTIDFFGFIKNLAAAVDLVLTAKTIAVFCPLFTAFFLIANAVSERKKRCKAGLTVVFILVCSAYFGIAAGDVIGEKKVFSTLAHAGVVSGALFCFFTFTMIAIAAALKPSGVKSKKYVAEICEISDRDRGEIKAYPLKSNVFPRGVNKFSANLAEFDKFLQKIEIKDLSFPDKIEYNRISSKAKFLSGVALTDKTVTEFCDVFFDSVKLAARYGVE